ncbi:hypothetical protein C0581_00710 [Candidatus Parcubacteria bacterium]|nr:MAG: hypothetical protein C0581_00710 [Candidatus Parcubacteria bacterium]
MAQENNQFDFLSTYIEALLVNNGLDDLSEEQKNVYIPQIMAHVEERIGLEVLPKLNDTQLDEFAKLTEGETTPEQWRDFWNTSIPSFEEDIKKILETFAGRVSQILSKNA